MGGFFVQDRWRAKPNLTINAGLRWELQGDPYDVLGISAFPDMANLFGPSTGLFTPGTMSGNNNPVMKVGQHATNARIDNFGPNLGIAWSPKFDGFLGKYLGASKMVIRTNYSLIYYDEGSNMFAWGPGGNPGKTQALVQTPGQGDAPYGMTLQSPLATFVGFPPQFVKEFRQSDFSYGGATFGTMNPNLRTPYTQNWNFGVQFEVAKNMVFEARYVGNRATHGWKTYSLNEINIFENGFLQEFKNAQNNLAINVANAKTGFANNGLPGQVALPILSAAFGPLGSMAALSNSQGWTSTSFVTALQNGTAGSMASTLATSSTYTCRMFGNSFTPCSRIDARYNAPGAYPINFFMLNPFSVGGLAYVDDNVFSTYHAMQLNFRRQYARGVSASVNYTWMKNLGNAWANSSNMAGNYQTLRNLDWAKGPTPHDLRHSMNAWVTWDLPIGKGKLLSFRNNYVDGVLGGWQLGRILTLQSGTVSKLTSGRATVNGNDSGVILMNGLTQQDLRTMVAISQGPASSSRYWLDPKLIGPDGRANPTYLGTPTTPGVWGETAYIRGRNNFNLDASLIKNFNITERVRMNIWFGAFNVLNHPVWGGAGFMGGSSVQSTSFGVSTSPSNSARSIQARGVINF
jgi:hypothetical protein